MRIGIDARFYGSGGKGLGRYTEKLIANLEKLDKQNQYFIFLGRANFGSYQPQNANFKKVLAPYLHYSWQEQVFFPHLLNKYGLDLVHFLHFNVPFFYRRPYIVTIHDLIYSAAGRQGGTRNSLIYQLKKIIYRIILRNLTSLARRIITISEFSRKQIVEYRPFLKDKITIVYEGVESLTNQVAEAPEVAIERRLEEKKFFLYIGNAYPHKNLSRLLESFYQLVSVKNDIYLVLVGELDVNYQHLKRNADHLGLEDKVYFSGRLKEKELVWLYQHAYSYIVPSLIEGFGLPALEAMFYGSPVLSSNFGPMPEIYGNAAIYFDPTNIRDMYRTMLRILDEKKLRPRMVAQGFEQIKKFSWEKMAREMINIYLNTK
jgi:glycosyltransferase involved in cell wall biosynthesis